MEKKIDSEKLLAIYNRSAALIRQILEGITNEQFNWAPSTETRSIGEMVRHLIRVDIWFFQQYGYALKHQDPGDVTPDVMLDAFVRHQAELADFIADKNTDFSKQRLDKNDRSTHSLADSVVHICHHYLYHFSQMVYLRRAKDRDWQTPLQDWEALTYFMGAQISEK